MSVYLSDRERSQLAQPDRKGVPTFEWNLSNTSITDTVRLIAGPFDVLPVVFVPGIMGSNLRARGGGESVWRLDTSLGQPLGLARRYVGQGPGMRQRLLHPDRVEVDDRGAVPGSSDVQRSGYRSRGWGTVAQGSYHSFLLWIEQQLNPTERNPARWSEFYQDQQTIGAAPRPGEEPRLFPGIRMGMQGQPFGAEKTPFDPVMTDDLMARSRFQFPIYACGYNWLASNDDAAALLQQRIDAIVRHWSSGAFRCKQVILVTHSMGGLVARACAQLPHMEDKIAGIVHGVMPAVGAAVAYRRCKVGMAQESFIAGLIIGSTGREVTSVFAQAPGALQLLPSQGYAPRWLRVMDANRSLSLQLPATGGDPYESIYLRRDRWWGLINEAWLSPAGGTPISWAVFASAIGEAKQFHADLVGSYHPRTFAYYGADREQRSFEKVTWRMQAGLRPDRATPPTAGRVLSMGSPDLRADGSSPEYVGGQTEFMTSVSPYGAHTSTYESSYWELHCEMQDGAGDGTVPVSSGSAPLHQTPASIKQQFRMTGFSHEPSFRDVNAQRVTVFSITKLAGLARRPG